MNIRSRRSGHLLELVSRYWAVAMKCVRGPLVAVSLPMESATTARLRDLRYAENMVWELSCFPRLPCNPGMKAITEPDAQPLSYLPCSEDNTIRFLLTVGRLVKKKTNTQAYRPRFRERGPGRSLDSADILEKPPCNDAQKSANSLQTPQLPGAHEHFAVTRSLRSECRSLDLDQKGRPNSANISGRTLPRAYPLVSVRRGLQHLSP